MIPQLRDGIDIRLIKDQAEQIILLSCKFGVSEPLALLAAVGPILMMLDGKNSIEAIKNKFSEHSVDNQIIDRVIQLLDDRFYLFSDNYNQRRQQILSDFRASKIRPAAHAGRIYPNDPAELNHYLDTLLNNQPLPDSGNGKLVALVAPHIDYRRGSSTYAHAYRQLAYQKPDICVLLGTSHQPGRSLFQLSTKDFACPNGTLAVEMDFLAALLSGYGEERALADELLHRQEHSLELQIPFLNYFCPDTRIVPVLVGSFYHYLRRNSKPQTDSEYREFVDCLAETISEFSAKGQNVAMIAGVDMAHVGQSFGDEFPLSEEKLAEIEAQDRIYLDSISSLSSDMMFEHIAKDGDQRRICGFPTMHTLLDVLEKQKKTQQVKLLDYQQAVDLETQCLVSFAAMGIYTVQ